MQKLPSKSLSKSILIATPLFCLILALLDASDQLSYLFALELLGNIAGSSDIMFIPTMQPEIKSDKYKQHMYFVSNNMSLPGYDNSAYKLPLINRQQILNWSLSQNIVKGISPRWIIPAMLQRTDCLILVADIKKQLQIGMGLKSNLLNLQENQIGVSQQLLQKLSAKIGDKIYLKLSVGEILNGKGLLSKYTSVESKQQQIIQLQQTNKQITNLVFNFLKQSNIQVQQQQISNLVKDISQYELQIEYKIKFKFNNKGLYTSTLNNVALMEYQGFSRLLYQILKQGVLQNKQIQQTIYDQLDKSNFTTSQKNTIKTYISAAKIITKQNTQIRQFIAELVYDYPLFIVANFKHRQLIYHPNRQMFAQMYDAVQKAPHSADKIALYPFYQDMEAMRYFFKSVIQIFTFVCAIIYYYIISLILKQVYQQKQIEVGIWRTLGAGGVKAKQITKENNTQIKLNNKLTLYQKLSYSYEMFVKVGFLYYWLFSCFVSICAYQLLKYYIYHIISKQLNYDSPPLDYILPITIFIILFGLTIGISYMHINKIYTNPLVQTIQPVKRTFDLVKVRLIKIATFGITFQMLIVGAMLVYYGVVSYYYIPLSILINDGLMQTLLFNSIFLFMIVGSVILVTVLQSRIQIFILKCLFACSKKLSCLKLLMLKSIKAKQYKNLKVSLVISIIFAFLLFFSCGLMIQIKIVESFQQRQLGAELIVQNFQKFGLNRTLIQQYLKKQKNIKYAWFSNQLSFNDNIKIQIEGVISNKRQKTGIYVVTPNFFDASYYEYYYPQYYYQNDKSKYQILSNGVYNGFNAIYQYDKLYNNISVGKFNSNDTIKQYDPNNLNVYNTNENPFNIKNYSGINVAPNQQIINIIVTNTIRKQFGAFPGDYFKMIVSTNKTQYYLRTRIMHSFKTIPGIDLFAQAVYISQDQAKYLYNISNISSNSITYYKLFIQGQNLNQIGNKIISMSPERTLMFNQNTIADNFELFKSYLNSFITIVTFILAILSMLFLTLYTYNKCQQDSLNFKMLRAIGLSVFDIRLMVYLQILIRIIVAMINGVILGIIFSRGLSGQIQQILLINPPTIDITPIIKIGLILLILFSITVIKATSFLNNKTVAQTAS